MAIAVKRSVVASFVRIQTRSSALTKIGSSATLHVVEAVHGQLIKSSGLSGQLKRVDGKIGKLEDC